MTLFPMCKSARKEKLVEAHAHTKRGNKKEQNGVVQ